VRILLIAFYFPPTGGGGVQRALKFCRYLPEFGVDVEVLTPKDSKWINRDDPLVDDIPAGTAVHRTAFPGPRAASRRDELFGAGPLRRLAVEARHLSARALIPDKAAPWMLTAAPAGVRLVRSGRFDAIVTTSPPSSTHLIGAAVQRVTGIPWIADFRDPWLAKIDRLGSGRGVEVKRTINRRLARMVAWRATALVAVTGAIADELHGMHPSAAAKTVVIENGSDFADFEQLEYAPGDRFVLTHAGSFFGGRSPRPTLSAVKLLIERRPELRSTIFVRFVGEMRTEDVAWAHTLGIDDVWENAGFRPYREALAAQRSADALLLMIEHADGRGDTVPGGKLWEYLAARRPVLATVPVHGVAGDMIRELNAGIVVDPEDEPAIAEAIERLVDTWSNGGLPDVTLPETLPDRISRRSRSKQMAELIDDVVAGRFLDGGPR
jgi:glycosyltransferase involved in cell wall biosynthesis